MVEVCSRGALQSVVYTQAAARAAFPLGGTHAAHMLMFPNSLVLTQRSLPSGLNLSNCKLRAPQDLSFPEVSLLSARRKENPSTSPKESPISLWSQVLVSTVILDSQYSKHVLALKRRSFVLPWSDLALQSLMEGIGVRFLCRLPPLR